MHTEQAPPTERCTHPYFEAGTGRGGAVKWECGFPHHKGGGQKPTYRSLFSPSTKWDRRIELRFSYLATDTLSAEPSHQPTERFFCFFFLNEQLVLLTYEKSASENVISVPLFGF